MKCPACKSRTEVLQTLQQKGGAYRRRRCVNPNCGRRFTTHETRDSFEQGDVERPVDANSILAKLQRLHPRVKDSFDPEALAAAIAVDRRRAEIKRRQREEDRMQDYDTDSFEPAPTRLDREGLRRELGCDFDPEV